MEFTRIQKGEVTIQPSSDDNLEKFRRIVECCSVVADVKIEICTRGKERNKKTGEQNHKSEEKIGRSTIRKKSPEDQTDVGIVVLKPTGRTFSDAMKDLKAKVCPEKMA